MTQSSTTDSHRCGYVAIIGRPNVGKSTLLNQLLGQKISITSHKPQTTRHRILGINSLPQAQIIYVDTPGIHLGGKKVLNKYLNRTASASLQDVDVIIVVLDSLKWTEDDETVIKQVKQTDIPVIIAVNKTDKITKKEQLLPHLQLISNKLPTAEILPISARNRDGLDMLQTEVIKRLRVSPAFFPQEQLTDKSERFIAAELVREKLMRTLGQELPYSTTVEIEKFEEQIRESGELRRISAIIWVERDGQKAIIIGKNGQQLKRIGEQARKDMENMFGGKVYLELWVKVKQGWSDDERAIQSLGYHDNQ